MFHFNRGLWLPFPRILYDFYVIKVVHGQYGSYMRLKNYDLDDHLKHPPHELLRFQHIQPTFC